MADISSVIADAGVGGGDTSDDSSTSEQDTNDSFNNDQDNETGQDTTQEDTEGVGEDGTETGEDTEENIPFHKHPRWKEMMSKLKSTQAENKQLKNQLNGGDQAQPPAPQGEQDGQVQQNQQKIQENNVDDPVLGEMLSSLSDPVLKSGGENDDYKNYKELYADFRKNILRDLVQVQRSSQEREQQASKAQETEFFNSLSRIENHIGDKETIVEFKRFAKEVYATEDFKTNAPTLEMVYATFLQEVKGKPKQAPNTKAAARVAGTSRPTIGKSNQPGYNKISRMSFDEIAQDMLGN